MRALFVHNRQAGSGDRAGEVASIASRLADAGWKVDVAPSASAAETEELVRRAAAGGLDAAIVAGGDGSINVAIQALAGRDTALGVIPTGTGNVWAREVGIPPDVAGATDVLLQGHTATVDLGRANDRYFLSIAGVGFDASVTRVMRSGSKRRLGRVAYVIAAATEIFKLRGQDATVIADGRALRQRVLMVAASNTRLYGGVLRMAPEALLDDGLLDVSIFRGRGLLTTLRHAVKAVLGIHRGDPEVETLQAARLLVDSPSRLPVQLDGDYFGTTPVEIRAVPRALRVIVPPVRHPQLREAG